MKKVSVMLAVLMALVMLPAAGVGADAADNGNMLVNPDFSVVDDPNTPENEAAWTIPGEGVEFASAVGHGDSSSLKITANKQEAYQIVTGISREQDYAFALYSTKDAGVTLSGNVRIYFRDADGRIKVDGNTAFVLLPGGSASATDTYATNSDGWTLFEYTISGASMPEGTTALEICLRCQSGNVNNAAEGAGFYVDDVWFGAASSAKTENMVKNPSFADVSTTGTGDSAKTWFDSWNANSSVNAAISSSFGHNDTNALMFLGGIASDSTYVTQEVSIEENKDYIFSFWYYNQSGGPQGKIQFYYYDADGDKLDGNYVLSNIAAGAANADKWTEVSVRLNAKATADDADAELPEGTAKVRIMLNKSKKGTENCNFYYDDLAMTEAASDIAYTVTDEEENVTTITSLTAGAVNVTYNANLASTETEASVVAVAVLFNIEGTKRLEAIRISDRTALVPGAKTAIDLGSFTVPDDTENYVIKVFSLESLSLLTTFEKFAALETAAAAS